MSDKEEKVESQKRSHADDENNSSDEEDGGWIGPLPTEAAPTKKRKGKVKTFGNTFQLFQPFVTVCYRLLLVLEHEKLYLENLPDSECYEKSYMHRDAITHVVCTKTDFVVTASIDGHVKFWKKTEDGIEFVKHFRAHLCKFLNS